MVKTPYECIRDKLQDNMPSHLLSLIPSKWEKIGEVLILKIPEKTASYRQEIAKVYAEVLGCKSVLEGVGGIEGECREPKVNHIYGDKDTETVHVENRVRYKLDPSKIMFSSGNMSERIRMSTIVDENETVVDMFAGIGYFSIPIAVYSTPKKVYAIEMNPTAYHYLCSNITLNNVNHIVKPLLGDNREVTPKGVADRVIMGYLRETYRYLPTAFASLRNRGIIHYHEVCPNEFLETRPFQRIKEAAKQFSLHITGVKKRIIKSYAPGVSHVVLDVDLERG